MIALLHREPARDVLNPCADRSHSIRELRTSYLTACDAIRLGGAF